MCRDLVIARIVEPTSKANASRVLSDRGVYAVTTLYFEVENEDELRS